MQHTSSRSISTRHGKIAVLDRHGEGCPVLMIHGNSSCKEAFRHQFASHVLGGRRLVAIDLPGHGASDDAQDPATTYCLGGYAETVTDVLDALRIARVALLGWSLGGHTALETIPRYLGIAGVMIVGAPPIRLTDDSAGKAFSQAPVMNLTFKEVFTEDDVLEYVRHTGVALPDDPHLIAMGARTDGRARSFLGRSFQEGRALDEIDIVETSTVPIAVLNGANDPFVQVSYLDTLAYGNLWGRQAIVLSGVGHAAFIEAPAIFDPILARFLGDLDGA